MSLQAISGRTLLLTLLLVAAGCGGGGSAPPDTVPNSFSFTAKIDAPTGAIVDSPAVTITGLGAAASVSITGGQYSIDGGAFTSAGGTIQNQQSIIVRVTASNDTYTPVTATVIIGGVSASFTVTTVPDTVPASFSFTNQLGVALNAVVESAAIVIGDIDVPVPITISGGEYAIDGGAFTNADGMIDGGQSLVVRVAAAGTFDTSVSVTVSIGGVTASFTVTTVPDTVPDPFSFTDQIDVGLGAQVDSAPVVIAGIAAPSPISITGGQYAIDGGAFGSSPSLIQNGQSVVVRVTAAVTLITTVDVTLTIGGVSDTFSATTFADVTAPTAVITYPPLTSRTGADSIRIRGTAADDYSTTAAVRVNGVLATTSDGFATWFANVSLTPELNVFAIETEDSEGNLDSTAAQAVVRRRVRFGEIQGIALGPNPGTIFVVDSAARALATLDLTTDERTIVSDNGIPNADYGFLIPKTVVVDPVSVNDRAFVLDPSLAGILSVDLSTGERTIFSDPSTPDTANLIQSAADMALDAANSRLLVVDSSRPAIIAVDLTTGVRAILSDATTPDGTNLFSAPREIAVDAANNRALVTNAFPYAVFAVDLASGTRTILSNDSIPDGVNPLTFPQDIAVDAANARALVAQPETDSILAIDLATGSRSILSSNTFPDSIDPIGDAIALEVDPANSRLLVMEQGTRRRIFGVDLGSGSRTILSSDEPELAANPFSEPTGIMLDPDNGRALVTDRENASVVAVNLATAERSIFSGIGTPDSSNPFSSPGEIVSDFAADRAYVLDEYRGGVDDAEIIAMNLSTGLRTVVTDEAYPDTVNTLTTPLNMTLDLSRNRILVSDVARTAVLAVDITTGERTVFSSNTIPDGVNPYTEPRGIVIDEAANRGLIVNSTSSFSSQILAVDVDTGARTLFSDITEPDGQNPFTGPTFVLLDVSNDRLFLVDRQQSQLMTVELASGARDLLSSNYAPFPANPFGGPTGIAYDEANEILYVVNQWFDGVLAVDTTTGHRVYVLQ